MLVAVLSILGGLLLFSGLLRFGAPWWFCILVSIFCVVPAVSLFGLRRGLESAVHLPEKVRALPHNTDGLTDDFTAVATALAGAKQFPKTPRQLVKTLTSSKAAYDAFAETSIGGVVGGATSLHPAGFAAAWVMTLWSLGYFTVGLFVNLLSGL